jgi:NAD(P)H-hydrate epimerase
MPVTCEDMQRVEAEAFARGVSAEELMEQAGRAIAEIVRQFYPVPGFCTAWCGKGHNGGDALVAARHLAAWGWRVDVQLTGPADALAPLTGKMLAALPERVPSDPPGRATVILDGLLGLGSRGAPRGELAAAVAEINRRRAEGAWVLAIDLPTGLDGDAGGAVGDCVQADLTATIGAVKTGLVADASTPFVGRLAVIPLAELHVAAGDFRPAVSRDLRAWLPPRGFDLHKGRCGRVGIIAGSPGYLGAARLCSAAAVQAGAGLVTLFARPEIAAELAVSCIPEVMVQEVETYRAVTEVNLDVLAIGPGLGRACGTEVLALVRDAVQPTVVDADALNLVATDPGLLRRCAGSRLLTPHPGEMERLLPQGDRTRRQWLEEFLARYPVTLLLKGSRTLIGEGSRPRWFNTTGNPGMASGGMGDVLTGVCAALAAQRPGQPLEEAATLGAWLCGRAAEVAVFAPGGSPESLSASGVLGALGAAFTDLRSGGW